RHILEREGYRVETRSTPPDPEELRRLDPHLLFMDVDLHEANGAEACRELKEQDRYCGLPVILISGHDTDRLRREATTAHASGYLAKPFDRRLLLEVAAHFTQH
ncbi:MAG TPA: response regulator, partial [Flavobacteriales bacterium]